MPIDYDKIVTRARDRIDNLKAVQAKFPEAIQHLDAMVNSFRYLHAVGDQLKKLDPEALEALGDAGYRLKSMSTWAYHRLVEVTHTDSTNVQKLQDRLKQNAASPD